MSTSLQSLPQFRLWHVMLLTAGVGIVLGSIHYLGWAGLYLLWLLSLLPIACFACFRATHTWAVGGIGCWFLILLMLPASQSAHSPRIYCRNHLRQLGLALQHYHSTYGSFPPAYTTDANGQPLLSWRVLILPFVEEHALYDQFHLDEPWDSPHNATLLQLMPYSYACPTHGGPPYTSYVAVVGPGTAWSGPTPTAISDIEDGTANTLLLIEARGANIPWTAPSDWAPHEIVLNAHPAQWELFKQTEPAGSSVFMANGSIRFVEEGTAPAIIAAWLTIAGGEKCRIRCADQEITR